MQRFSPKLKARNRHHFGFNWSFRIWKTPGQFPTKAHSIGFCWHSFWLEQHWHTIAYNFRLWMPAMCPSAGTKKRASFSLHKRLSGFRATAQMLIQHMYTPLKFSFVVPISCVCRFRYRPETGWSLHNLGKIDLKLPERWWCEVGILWSGFVHVSPFGIVKKLFFSSGSFSWSKTVPEPILIPKAKTDSVPGWLAECHDMAYWNAGWLTDQTRSAGALARCNQCPTRS